MNENPSRTAVAASHAAPAGMKPPASRVRARRASRVADAIAFLRGFLARPGEVASVLPSSASLEAELVRSADLAHARCVVELGPGTGGTTRALLRALPFDARLLAIELNPEFCRRLEREIDDPRLLVHEGSAEALPDVLRGQGLPPADVIVSGIPFSVLSPEAAQRVAAAVHQSLSPGGCLVAYQFRRHVVQYLTPFLGRPRMTLEWRCVPPMHVFVWGSSPAGV